MSCQLVLEQTDVFEEKEHHFLVVAFTDLLQILENGIQLLILAQVLQRRTRETLDVSRVTLVMSIMSSTALRLEVRADLSRGSATCGSGQSLGAHCFKSALRSLSLNFS